MEGWNEEEFKNKDLMAPCGLYCGACGIYISKRDGNEKFKAIMGRIVTHTANVTDVDFTT